MNSGSTKIHFADGAITCEDFRVMRDEGIGSGSFTYDFKKHEVRISNIKSSLHPAEAILWIDPKVWETVVPYKFRRPPVVTATGLYQFRGGKTTRLEITVDGTNGMDYVFLGKTLPFDRVNRTIALHQRSFGNYRSSRRPSFRHAAWKCRHLTGEKRSPLSSECLRGRNQFPGADRLYYNYKTAHGQLSGTYDSSRPGERSARHAWPRKGGSDQWRRFRDSNFRAALRNP